MRREIPKWDSVRVFRLVFPAKIPDEPPGRRSFALGTHSMNGNLTAIVASHEIPKAAQCANILRQERVMHMLAEPGRARRAGPWSKWTGKVGRILDRTLTSQHTGVWHPQVERGHTVAEGALIGRISDFQGRTIE